jgi:uncharacterized protein YdhG (YjbR/CyaY superfamily)
MTKLDVDAHVASAPELARPILQQIRELVALHCPNATEVISYGMPASKEGKVFIYFAAFKHHIGIFPPLKEPASLIRKLAPFRGPKGNLQFRYAEGIPFDLIEQVVKALHASYSVKK